MFDATNLRREWASTTVAAKCPELLIHDLRRSGARNLVNAGVPETVAMKIGELEDPFGLHTLRNRRNQRHPERHECPRKERWNFDGT